MWQALQNPGICLKNWKSLYLLKITQLEPYDSVHRIFTKGIQNARKNGVGFWCATY